MIRVTKTGTGDAPRFFCDQCNLSIERITLGLYLWKELDTFRREEGQESEMIISPLHPSVLVEDGKIYTLHKSCADAFEKQHGGNHFKWPWIELTDLLIFLIHNGGLTLEDLQKRMDARRDLWGNKS